jgi:transposase InsO family protein
VEEYNHFRLHSSLNNLSLAEVVEKHQLREVKET